MSDSRTPVECEAHAYCWEEGKCRCAHAGSVWFVEWERSAWYEGPMQWQYWTNLPSQSHMMHDSLYGDVPLVAVAVARDSQERDRFWALAVSALQRGSLSMWGAIVGAENAMAVYTAQPDFGET